ncbi:hypothetical protein JTB14_013833 [Gonioctena quinquepunctata]|nr:hypothetical protein JTB14_013833 [Gonioctena quinquepunctata]
MYSNIKFPQESTLGLLLFDLFVNDIDRFIECSGFLLYADDLKLGRELRDIADCVELQKNLDGIAEFCSVNELQLNEGKCKVVTFTRKKKPIMWQYAIGATTLERLDHIKDLGVIFNSSLNFNMHIEYIVKDADKKLSFVLRNTTKFKWSTLTIVYNAYVRSKLEYASANMITNTSLHSSSNEICDVFVFWEKFCLTHHDILQLSKIVIQY